MLKFVIAIALIMHDLANLASVVAPWAKSMLGFKDASWLFSRNITYRSNVGRAFSLLWLVSTVCLLIAGVGLILEQPWWLPAVIAGCLCSFFAVVPWWKAVVPGAYFGAVFDALIIILLATPLSGLLLRSVP
jgi:hypothetical protein